MNNFIEFVEKKKKEINDISPVEISREEYVGILSQHRSYGFEYDGRSMLLYKPKLQYEYYWLFTEVKSSNDETHYFKCIVHRDNQITEQVTKKLEDIGFPIKWAFPEFLEFWGYYWIQCKTKEDAHAYLALANHVGVLDYYKVKKDLAYWPYEKSTCYDLTTRKVERRENLGNGKIVKTFSKDDTLIERFYR